MEDSFFKKLKRLFRSEKSSDGQSSADPSSEPVLPLLWHAPALHAIPHLSSTGSIHAGQRPQYGVRAIMGHRPNMEDSHTVVPDVVAVPAAWVLNLGTEKSADSSEARQSSPDAEPSPAPEAEPKLQPEAASHSSLHFFAVYDGHGGSGVSEHCSKRLHEHFRLAVQQLQPGLKKDKPQESADTQIAPAVDCVQSSITEAFLLVDKELLKKGNAKDKGTTAVVALLSNKCIWVANCGDSRAVLVRGADAVELSSDHKASRPDEVARIEQAGGYVWWSRVMGELAISRAIGDHKLRPFVIATPEVTRTLRQSTDEMLIIASDGLWDVFTSKDAGALAMGQLSEELGAGGSRQSGLTKAATALTKAALARGSKDNVTVLCVDLRMPVR